MNLLQDAAQLLETLLTDLREELGEQLAGLYLRGSLALGDFDPATSDIDVLAATELPVTDARFARLAALHARLSASPNAYANRMEMAYIDRTALRRFEPGRRHPTLGQGETLVWNEHRDHWILERWTTRERGVALLGPDPRTLIDPISEEALRTAVRARLRDWDDWANHPDDPEWLLPRSHQAYVVETMCRALFTLAYGELPTKPRAVAWALASLPDPWQATVARSRTGRSDRTSDPASVQEVLRFVHWAANHS